MYIIILIQINNKYIPFFKTLLNFAVANFKSGKIRFLYIIFYDILIPPTLSIF